MHVAVEDVCVMMLVCVMCDAPLCVCVSARALSVPEALSRQTSERERVRERERV